MRTHNIPFFNITKKITLIIPNLQPFLGTPARVRNSHGKQAISVRAIEVLLYLHTGLEKSSVLPVLDRFLSLKTDFVLNRKQKNRSIKVRFFRPILNASL